MRLEVVREKVELPPVKEYVISLSAEEGRRLAGVINVCSWSWPSILDCDDKQLAIALLRELQKSL